MRQFVELLQAFLMRDLHGRYRGSTLGLLWYIINPLLMLTVYTLVFSKIFGMRWGNSDGGTVMFALNLFAGLLVNGFFAEALQRGCQSILSQPNLVKKVTFPLPILPLVVSLSSFVHFLLGSLVLLGLVMFQSEAPLRLALLLLWLPPMLLLASGLAWMVAALTVFIRDLAQIIGLGLSALIFLAPIFYPFSQVPEAFRSWMLLNPLTMPTEAMRAALLGGAELPGTWLLLYWAVALGIFFAGWHLFKFLKKGFADVL